jgi:hypothetical protein
MEAAERGETVTENREQIVGKLCTYSSHFDFRSNFEAAGCVFFFPFCARVARGFVFKPEIPIWVNFGGP